VERLEFFTDSRKVGPSVTSPAILSFDGTFFCRVVTCAPPQSKVKNGGLAIVMMNAGSRIYYKDRFTQDTDSYQTTELILAI